MSSILKLLILVFIVASCDGEKISSKNFLWKQADSILDSWENIYKHLANYVEDASNSSKRIFSIVAVGVIRYCSGEYSSSDASSLVDVTQPADVIASDFRVLISTSRAITDPVVNIIKTTCRPETPMTTCSKLFMSAVENQTEMCSDFPNHFAIYSQTVQLFNNKDVKAFIEDLINFSESGADDKTVLTYINDVIDGKKFLEARDEILLWYAVLSNGDYSCNLPPSDCINGIGNDDGNCLL